MILRTHEAKLQIKMATLHGFFVSVPSGGAAAGGGGAGAPRPTIGRTLRYEDWGGEAKVWRPEAGAEGKAAG